MKKLLALFLFSVLLLFACDMFNADMPEYLEQHAHNVVITNYELDRSYPSDINGIVNITSEEDKTITFTLRNLKQYDIDMGINWSNSLYSSTSRTTNPQPTIDYILEQDPTDKNLARLTFTQAFLENTDNSPANDNISGIITMVASETGRVFEPYAYNLVSNSPPLPPTDSLLMKEDSGRHFVLCVKLPNFTDKLNQQDIRKLRITDTVTGMLIDEYHITPSDGSGAIMAGDRAITNYNGKIIEEDSPTLVAWKDDETAFPSDYDVGGHGVFYRTSVEVIYPLNYTVTLIDDKGLSSTVTISATPPVLENIYIDGVNGDDSNDGATPATAFRTFAKAKERVQNGKAICITNTVTISTYEVWSLAGKTGVIIKRYGGDGATIPAFTGALVNITGGTLTLENIIIDGQGGVSGECGGAVDAQSAMVTVNGGTLTLNNNAILQNNKNSATTGGGVSIIRGILNLAGTEISINGNTSNNVANNVAYINSGVSSPVKVAGLISVANSVSIGLSPTDITRGALLVEATDASNLDTTHFGLDTPLPPGFKTEKIGSNLKILTTAKPTINGIALKSNNNTNTLAKAGDRITLTVTADDNGGNAIPTIDAYTATMAIGGAATRGGTWNNNVFTYRVKAGETGNVTYSVTVANNIGDISEPAITGTGSVLVDTTPPTASVAFDFTGRTIAEDHYARAGDEIRLTVVADDVGGSGVATANAYTATIWIGGSVKKLLPSSNTIFTYEIKNGEGGVIRDSVIVRDKAGNTFSITSGNQIEVDTTPPGAPRVLTAVADGGTFDKHGNTYTYTDSGINFTFSAIDTDGRGIKGYVAKAGEEFPTELERKSATKNVILLTTGVYTIYTVDYAHNVSATGLSLTLEENKSGSTISGVTINGTIPVDAKDY